jgi:hypothetical protein
MQDEPSVFLLDSGRLRNAVAQFPKAHFIRIAFRFLQFGN